MFIHYRTIGLVLKKEDRGEADQLFTIYTKDYGTLEIFGRAIRKISSKLRAGADIFYLSEIEFIQGKTKKTLTDAILIEKFRNLRKSLGRLAVAYKISEIFTALVKHPEPEEKIWELLVKTFKRLDASYKLEVISYNKIYYYFFWNLIKILGYQPEFYRCSICQKKLSPEKIYFNQKGGEIICQKCYNTKRTKNDWREINSNTIKILRVIVEKDWPFFKKIKINKELQRELGEISEDYFLCLKKSFS